MATRSIGQSLLKPLCFIAIAALSLTAESRAMTDKIEASALRVEYLEQPDNIDTRTPRFSWVLTSTRRGAAQTAWQIRAATSPERLAAGDADLWDSDKVIGQQTNQIAYAGRTLASREDCFWQVRVWDEFGEASTWSPPTRWRMGLLSSADWSADWITFRDDSSVHSDRNKLLLPPARHYRKQFAISKEVRRAIIHASALGLYDLYCNGQRVGDAYFQPGWSDYHQRAYYRSHDVTALVRAHGENALGAVVADGWYAGYVGFGLLVGYGPEKSGRSLYGKTPAFIAQLELDYTDGTHETVVTDPTWRVTDRGPTREADLLMGETYDARAELGNWSEPGYNDNAWDHAVAADSNPIAKAMFYEGTGQREVNLGFVRPPKMKAYNGPPVCVTQELPAQSVSEPTPGVFVYDLGQNFAGVIRLKIKGSAGEQIRIRHAEMLKPDGTLMTENLRKARATDTYTLRGDPAGETWSPRFTYHGFRYVELTGLATPPPIEAVTGLVLHSDTPPTGNFECSDPVMSRFARNAQWTQHSNFVEIPTDCPQRDERLGWTGDVQAYIGTAVLNADVAAFFTKWMDDLNESQRSFGAYPDYAPYPMAHGAARKTFGSAWTDVGIICPWTIWQTYGDTGMLQRHWDSMTRFMEWRWAGTTPEGLGTQLGNPWGDWLNIGEPTPLDFIDTCYLALDLRMMEEMARAIGRPLEAQSYLVCLNKLKAAFRKKYLTPEGGVTISTQTAQVLALSADLIPAEQAEAVVGALAGNIEQNNFRMKTGFLGTKSLLPMLSAHGRHDLAVRLFQSRQFPSWGYEVVNGATTVWERWDSYTTEHGFNGVNGKQNARMNSFSHYAFGAVMEWAYRTLAGIDSDGVGFRRIIIRPRPPAPDSNPAATPVNWVKADYTCINGKITSAWTRENNRFVLDVTIPANTTGTIYLPTATPAAITEGGLSLAEGKILGIAAVSAERNETRVEVTAGSYHFVVSLDP